MGDGRLRLVRLHCFEKKVLAHTLDPKGRNDFSSRMQVILPDRACAIGAALRMETRACKAALFSFGAGRGRHYARGPTGATGTCFR